MLTKHSDTAVWFWKRTNLIYHKHDWNLLPVIFVAGKDHNDNWVGDDSNCSKQNFSNDNVGTDCAAVGVNVFQHISAAVSSNRIVAGCIGNSDSFHCCILQILHCLSLLTEKQPLWSRAMPGCVIYVGTKLQTAHTQFKVSWIWCLREWKDHWQHVWQLICAFCLMQVCYISKAFNWLSCFLPTSLLTPSRFTCRGGFASGRYSRQLDFTRTKRGSFVPFARLAMTKFVSSTKWNVGESSSLSRFAALKNCFITFDGTVYC